MLPIAGEAGEEVLDEGVAAEEEGGVGFGEGKQSLVRVCHIQ